MQATWAGLEQAYLQNLTKAIGVSNYKIIHIQEILDSNMMTPMVNQCPYHIGNHDDETVAFCQAHNVTYQAYSPLGGPDLHGKSVLTYPALKQVAANHNVSGE